MGGGAEGGMMMKAIPCAPLEVIEPEFALHLLVVAFDAPAELAEAHQRP